MTNKQKKRVRNLKGKTGMTHQEAHNALRKEPSKTEDMTDSSPPPDPVKFVAFDPPHYKVEVVSEWLPPRLSRLRELIVAAFDEDGLPLEKERREMLSYYEQIREEWARTDFFFEDDDDIFGGTRGDFRNRWRRFGTAMNLTLYLPVENLLEELSFLGGEPSVPSYEPRTEREVSGKPERRAYSGPVIPAGELEDLRLSQWTTKMPLDQTRVRAFSDRRPLTMPTVGSKNCRLPRRLEDLPASAKARLKSQT